MSSTSFNVGLGGATRPSSRVLRPPGGGHTNIFGAGEPEPIKKDMGRNASSILEGTNASPPSPAKPTAVPDKPTSNQPAATQSAATQAPRSKVPPGGFSSGLW